MLGDVLDVWTCKAAPVLVLVVRNEQDLLLRGLCVNLNSGGIYALRGDSGRLFSEEFGKLHPS